MKTTKYSAKALIVSKNDPRLVLLVRERLTNNKIIYDLPGGKIESGETPIEALNRELDEELSIKVDVGEKIGEYRFDDERLHVKVICYTFLCTFDPQMQIDLNNNPAEHENIIEVKWLKVEKILAANLPGVVPSLRKLLEKIIL